MSAGKILAKLFIVLAVFRLSCVLTVTGCKTDNDDNSGQQPTEPNVDPDIINTGLTKYEFRSVWVSTVDNLDISSPASQNSFRTAYKNILDTCEAWNMNAVIFQVRPMLDAWYPSTINPWSQFLTRMQGDGSIVSGWDPLAIMVEETHKRGMEFHAWFNPYRVTSRYAADDAIATANSSLQGYTVGQLDELTVPDLIDVYKITNPISRRLAPNNYAVLHPDKVYRFGRAMYLDAGYPEVRQHIVDTIKEVIENYDIDAVHFDDYFYPYSSGYGSTSTGRTPSLNILTAASYALYGTEFDDTAAGWREWWRDNNTKLITDVKNAIAAENSSHGKAIQFGVSPFGVWARNTTATVPPGAGSTTGSTNDTYSQGVYADTYNWVQNELVDYMAPQIYWEFEHESAAYGTLAPWWANVHNGKNVHLYVGHANYKHTDPNNRTRAGWQKADQILDQLKFNKDYSLIKGSSFFSYSTITAIANTNAWDRVLLESNSKIKAYWGQYKTIVPPKPWLNSTVPTAPANVTKADKTISWNSVSGARYYAVYRIPTVTPGSNNAATVIADPSKIVAKVWHTGGSEPQSFTDTTESPSQYTYIVTALNAAHVESAPAVATAQ